MTVWPPPEAFAISNDAPVDVKAAKPNRAPSGAHRGAVTIAAPSGRTASLRENRSVDDMSSMADAPERLVETMKCVPEGAQSGQKEIPPPASSVWTPPPGNEISRTSHSIAPVA